MMMTLIIHELDLELNLILETEIPLNRNNY